MWETWVRSLGWEDPLKKGKATHSSILAWRIMWTVQSKELQRVRRNWATFTSLYKRLLSSSSLSAIRMVLSTHMRLLIFLLAILIPACGSSSLAFCMMYSAYKLNKQGDNIQPCHTSFPILNQSVIPRLVLTVASWPTYRFLRRQVRWSGIPVFLIISHSLSWYT